MLRFLFNAPGEPIEGDIVLTRVRRLMGSAGTALLTGGAQAVVQLAGLVSGVLVIRNLTPEQYAYYTIATSALGVMTVLMDSGVGNGVLAYGGQVWQDRTRLGAIVAAGLGLRRQLALFALAVSLPITGWLLRHQGAGWVETILVTASILPLYVATVSGQLLETVPRLHQHLLPLQRIQIGSNLGRAALIAIVLPWWPLAAVAASVTSIPQWIGNWRLRKLADSQVDWRVAVDPEIRARLLVLVRRTMPGAIYYALSGQLTVWLISIFGATTSVAAVGALGRLAMILSVLGAVFGVIAVPRFARIPDHDRHRVARRYWQSQLLVAAACAVPIVAMAAFPDAALAVLGPHYSGLHREVVLMAASSMAGLMGGAAYSLGAARGIVAPPLLIVSYCVVGQVLLILLLPLSTVSGVIWVGLLSAASQWVLHVAWFSRAMRRSNVIAS